MKASTVILIWFALFGVWPIADPQHGLDTMASVIDVTIHLTAVAVLATRYRIVRRQW